MNFDVSLRMLGTGFQIACETEAWARLLERLWEPFVARKGDGANGMSIARHGEGGWVTTCAWHPRLVQPDPWLMANEIRHLVVERSLALAEAVSIHGAAMALGPCAVVLVGESGAGKTTLSFELAKRGCDYVTDDVVVLGPDATITPFPKPLGIKEASEWDRFAHEMEDLGWPGPPSDLFLIPPRVLGWRDLDDEVAVAAVMFLVRGSDGRVELFDISAARALADIGPHTRPVDRRTLPALRALCSAGRCARLVTDDPKAAADVIVELLDG